jgi:hypothetical protein
MTAKGMTKSMLALALMLAMEGTALADEKDWGPELQAIADKCGIPRENLKWIDGSVRWLKPEASSYDQATCVFEQLKVSGIPMNQGFVSGGS